MRGRSNSSRTSAGPRIAPACSQLRHGTHDGAMKKSRGKSSQAASSRSMPGTPMDVADLVRVADDGAAARAARPGGPALPESAACFPGACEHRSAREPRIGPRWRCSAGGPLVGANAGDPAVRDPDVARADFAGEHVDDLAASQEQIARLLARAPARGAATSAGPREAVPQPGVSLRLPVNPHCGEGAARSAAIRRTSGSARRLPARTTSSTMRTQCAGTASDAGRSARCRDGCRRRRGRAGRCGGRAGPGRRPRPAARSRCPARSGRSASSQPSTTCGWTTRLSGP